MTGRGVDTSRCPPFAFLCALFRLASVSEQFEKCTDSCLQPLSILKVIQVDQDIGERNAKTLSQSTQRIEGSLLFPPFEPAQVGIGDSTKLGQLFLAVAPFLPGLPDPSAYFPQAASW